MILLSSSFQSAMELLGVLLIFAFVLVITYYTSKWIGSYQKMSMHNKNLQVIESVKVGTNKFLCLVKAGEIYLVVAVGKDEVTMLTQLTKEQLSEVPIFDDLSHTTENAMIAENFREVLEKVKQHFPKK